LAQGAFEELSAYSYPMGAREVAGNYRGMAGLIARVLAGEAGGVEELAAQQEGGAGGGQMLMSMSGGLCLLSPVVQGNNVALTISGAEVGGLYDLFLITNLNPPRVWKLLARSAPGQTNLAVAGAPLPQGFFQLGTVLDSDGDGLTDAFEALVSANGDADGDGLPGDWEALHGLNPSVNDAAVDSDGDGWTNWQEYQAGTDPASAPVLAAVVTRPSGVSPVP
jgi:hypothetical protein